MDDGRGTYVIDIDGQWSLEDLYIFPRSFEQVYFALQAISPTPDEDINERIERAFRAFPWMGGYSAVNFYNQLRMATPKRKRPKIESIKYASPGWIELSLIVSVACNIGLIVDKVAGALKQCNDLYHEIYVAAQQRKLLRIEVEQRKVALTAEELRFLSESADLMARLLEIPSVAHLHRKTGSPLITLKVLLSLYRRVRTLSEYQANGKVRLSDEAPGGQVPRH